MTPFKVLALIFTVIVGPEVLAHPGTHKRAVQLTKAGVYKICVEGVGQMDSLWIDAFQDDQLTRRHNQIALEIENAEQEFVPYTRPIRALPHATACAEYWRGDFLVKDFLKLPLGLSIMRHPVEESVAFGGVKSDAPAYLGFPVVQQAFAPKKVKVIEQDYLFSDDLGTFTLVEPGIQQEMELYTKECFESKKRPTPTQKIFHQEYPLPESGQGLARVVVSWEFEFTCTEHRTDRVLREVRCSPTHLCGVESLPAE